MRVYIKPLFGDHLLVSITVRLEKKVSETSIRRDWRKYSKELLIAELSLFDWSSEVNNRKTLFGCFSNLRYKYIVGFQVPNFLILKILVFQFGINKSNLKSNFRLSNVPSRILYLS